MPVAVVIVGAAVVVAAAGLLGLKRKWGARRTGAAIVGTAALCGFLALGVTLKTYRIPSAAMEPTLVCSETSSGCSGDQEDRVLALRLVGTDPGRSDVVTFRVPDRWAARCGSGGTFVKRVVALPGETVAGRAGRILVNGKPLREPYVEPDRRGFGSFGPVRLPRDAYFLLGDNRMQSCDSRVGGPLPRDNMIARVIFRYWPPSRIGRVS